MRVTSIMGLSRECVAQKYQRLKMELIKDDLGFTIWNLYPNRR